MRPKRSARRELSRAEKLARKKSVDFTESHGTLVPDESNLHDPASGAGHRSGAAGHHVAIARCASAVPFVRSNNRLTQRAPDRNARPFEEPEPAPGLPALGLRIAHDCQGR